MRNRTLVLISVFWVLSFPAFAEGVETRLREADKELNRVYNQLRSELANKPRQALKQAQRAWIDYRDRKCAFEAGFDPDGHEDWIHQKTRPAKDPVCLLAMTRQRSDELQAYRKGVPLSRQSVSAADAADQLPEGAEGLRYLVNQGKLRPASKGDIHAWIEKARADREDLGKDWNPGLPRPARDYYVVLDQIRFPEGLAGAHAAGFIVPMGAPVPSGDPGHSQLYFMNNGACQGSSCP